MSLRFSFDLGTNSIGWAVYRTNPPETGGKTGVPVELCDAGVRVFPDSRDPQSQQSLAADRRDARSARRRRDRYVQRRRYLMSTLVKCGLMPENEAKQKALVQIPKERKDELRKEGLSNKKIREALGTTRAKMNPYNLRARALDKKLEPHEIGRALFHLNQRRGFKSNRKTDAGDKEAEGMKAAIKQLEEKLHDENARTIGEWLARRHQHRADGKPRPQDVRFRGQLAGQKMEWEFYPQRAMLEREFDAIWEAQEQHHPALLTDAARARIRDIIFYQRPLKPVPAGKCTFEVDEDRAAKALPTAERVRILQELNHLHVRPTPTAEQQPLTLEERDKLLKRLKTGSSMKWNAVCKALRLPDTATFNLQSERRKELKGDETARRLGVSRKKNMDAADLIGRQWHELPLATQDEVVLKLIGNEDDDSVCEWLVGQLGITRAQAQNMVNTSLPSGYARLSKKAMDKILPRLKSEVITYNRACEKAGYDHARPVEETGEVFNRLPRYQEIEAFNRQLAGSRDPKDKNQPDKYYGRYPNPTVHVGLNQLRRVVNALAEKHGVPSEIVLEIARDLKNSADDRKRISKQQAENQKKNDERDEKIRELGFPASGENRMRLRLWEDLNQEDTLDRRCPYTGKQISIQMLFSDEVDIDHILPWSRTLDNSAANRTVCIREANRRKGDWSPAEAVERGIFEQSDIDCATANLPGNKKWRFSSDAMERFENGEHDFLDRQLMETRWLSRLARTYLAHMCHKNHVWVVTGQLTAMLRGKWGLNGILGEGDRKQRNDHRHHAVDAAVIGAIDRGMLQRAARENARGETDAGMKLDIAPPLENFRDSVCKVVDRIVVSHKPDHGAGGQLHEETAYGVVKDPDDEDGMTLVARKPVSDLTKPEISRIRDTRIRHELQDMTRDIAAKGLPGILARWSEKNGIRRLRVLKKEQTFINIDDRKTGKPYRAVIAGENHHLDVFEMPDGELEFRVATVFQVNQPDWKAEAPAGGRLVMRLHKGDMVKIDGVDGARQVMRVQRIGVMARRVVLVPHNEAGNYQKRHDDPNDPFRWEFFGFGSFTERRLRPVIVSPTGKVKPRRPPEK